MIKISISIGIVCMVNNTAILEQATLSNQNTVKIIKNETAECSAALSSHSKHNVIFISLL